MLHYLETVGTVLVVLLCSVISLILVTERSFLNSMRNGGDRIRELSREDAVRRREMHRSADRNRRNVIPRERKPVVSGKRNDGSVRKSADSVRKRKRMSRS